MNSTECIIVLCIFVLIAERSPILVQNLSAHIEKLFVNDKCGFSEEYKVRKFPDSFDM